MGDKMLNINLLFIIVVIILILGALFGWKRGLLSGVIRLVSCILGILVVIVVAKGVGSFMQGSYANVIIAFILLLSIRIFYKIVTFLLDTFKLVRAVPVGKLADKLAGTVLGFAEAVFIVWFVFFLIGSFDILKLNSWMLEQVSKSRFLTILYYSNYLVELLRRFLV